MQNIKNSLFLYLTPRQKSQLFGTLKSYFKKFNQLSSSDLTDKFLEDEKYYLDMNNPHFEFMENYLDDDNFYKDAKKYFDFLSYENEQKEKLKPFLDKQKELLKIQKIKIQEYKMSKMKPTKKQLYYYEKLAKAHNIKMNDVTNASRLDLRNWIMEILDK